MTIKPGDKIISELDNNEYEVIDYGSRDKLDPLLGVKQLGNIILVKDINGNKHFLYEWEIVIK